MRKFIENLPKIDIHVHLDGSVNPGLLCELSHLPCEEVKKRTEVNEQCHDLNDYLTKFSFPLEWMQEKENLIRITKEFVERLQNDHVVYAEIRFAPQLHCRKGLTQREVAEAVLKGIENSPYQLILCMMRGGRKEDNAETISVAETYLGRGVCALDLAGAEALYPTGDFEDFFRLAQAKGIPFTIHAGEADGIKSMEAALKMGAKRLGHGVRVVEDEDLLKQVIFDKVPLEICPTSNLNTGLYDKLEKHPIYDLYQRGVQVTVNTDNQTVSATTLSRELNLLMDHFPFSYKDILVLEHQAVDAAFLPDDRKEYYHRLIDEYGAGFDKEGGS